MRVPAPPQAHGRALMRYSASSKIMWQTCKNTLSKWWWRGRVYFPLAHSFRRTFQRYVKTTIPKLHDVEKCGFSREFPLRRRIFAGLDGHSGSVSHGHSWSHGSGCALHTYYTLNTHAGMKGAGRDLTDMKHKPITGKNAPTICSQSRSVSNQIVQSHWFYGE